MSAMCSDLDSLMSFFAPPYDHNNNYILLIIYDSSFFLHTTTTKYDINMCCLESYSIVLVSDMFVNSTPLLLHYKTDRKEE